MARQVDALIAATLKNVREQWWDADLLGVPSGDTATAIRAIASSTSGPARAPPS